MRVVGFVTPARASVCGFVGRRGKLPLTANATVSSFASPARPSSPVRADDWIGAMIEVHGRGVFSAGWHAGSGLNPEVEAWKMKP